MSYCNLYQNDKFLYDNLRIYLHYTLLKDQWNKCHVLHFDQNKICPRNILIRFQRRTDCFQDMG